MAKKQNNPVTALILGVAINENPPIMRRDSDGDISSRLSDDQMAEVGLRAPKYQLNRSTFMNYNEEDCKKFKSFHKKFGKNLNSAADKADMIKQMNDSIPAKSGLRMNAKLIVVGHTN